MSNLEVEAFIDAELERNPLLQRDDGEAEADAPSEFDGPAIAEQMADAEARADLDAIHDDASPGDRATGDAPEAFSDVGGAIDWSKAGSGSSYDQDGEGFEGRLARELTLSEYLQGQLAASGLSPAETIIAGVLIDAVDDSGYLRAEITEIADRLRCDGGVERVLGIIQGFDPVGIAARDVRECLMIQLKDRNRYDPAMAALLDNLPLLANRDLSSLRKLCGVD